MFSCNENHCAKYVYYAAHVCLHGFLVLVLSTDLSEMQIGSKRQDFWMVDSG